MALPTWLARFNRRYVNPMAIRGDKWSVLVHVGRTSGTVYRTPLEAYPTADGYLFTVNYKQSDWPKNVVHADGATLETSVETIALTDPKLVSVEAGYALLGPDANTPPAWVGVEQCLVTKVAGATRSTSDSETRSRSSS